MTGKFTFTFSFENAGLIHTWTKTFYTSDIIKSIELYLENKEFPFGITKKDIKWSSKIH